MNVAAEVALAQRTAQDRDSGNEDARPPDRRDDDWAGATWAAMRRGAAPAQRSGRPETCLRRRLRLAAVAATALLASACAAERARSPEQRAGDEALALRVEYALAQDPNIYARHIDVEADSGVIRLSGFVWAADDYYEARKIAARVPGVIKVFDQLELVVGGRTGAR